jgi:hypothetical protein
MVWRVPLRAWAKRVAVVMLVALLIARLLSPRGLAAYADVTLAIFWASVILLIDLGANTVAQLARRQR